MKNRYLVLSVMLLGCSAGPEASDEPELATESEELGQIDEGMTVTEVEDIGEAIEHGDDAEKTTMQDGYGGLRYSTASQILPQTPQNDRCYLPLWYGIKHTCIVPANRTITLRTGSADDGDIHWTAAYNDAVTRFSTVMNARGWKVKQASNGGDTVNLGATNNGALGETRSSFNASDCHDFAGAGKICYTGACTIVISPTVLRKNGGWNTASQAQKDRMLTNVLLHELGHCGGLNHFPSPSDGVKHVMNASAISDYYNGVRGYTDNDMNMFQAFRP
jgi:hypothetical protein